MKPQNTGVTPLWIIIWAGIIGACATDSPEPEPVEPTEYVRPKLGDRNGPGFYECRREEHHLTDELTPVSAALRKKLGPKLAAEIEIYATSAPRIWFDDLPEELGHITLRYKLANGKKKIATAITHRDTCETVITGVDEAWLVDWPAAGLMDTEKRCFIELEDQHGTKEVYARV